jgi:hypothetical protein
MFKEAVRTLHSCQLYGWPKKERRALSILHLHSPACVLDDNVECESGMVLDYQLRCEVGLCEIMANATREGAAYGKAQDSQKFGHNELAVVRDVGECEEASRGIVTTRTR